jgi:hypothetical protein
LARLLYSNNINKYKKKGELTMRRLSRFFISAVLAGLMVLSIPMAVLAVSFGINIMGPGGFNQTVQDNQGGGDPLDTNPLPNLMNVSVPIPGFFTVNIDTAITNAPGLGSGGTVDLGWQVATNLVDPNTNVITIGLGGQIVITASATGFLFPPNGPGSTLTSTVGGTVSTGGDVTAQQWDNPSNGQFATDGFTPGPQGPFTGGFGNTASVDFTSVLPYSITDRLIINLPTGTVTTFPQSSGDLNSSTSGKIPEPISLILLGSGLAGVGLYRRLRKPKG